MRIRHIKNAEEIVDSHPLVITEPSSFKGCWSKKVFGNDNPLYLEIGTGMGTFIRESAVANPEVNYVGLEMNSTVLLKSIRRYEGKVREEEGLSPEDDAPILRNLRFIRCDARLICDFFEKGEVDRIYLNFSDPWPKDKNANKRLTSPMFLRRYKEILKEGARVEFKTDNRGLFDYSVETAREEGWKFSVLTYDLHGDSVLSEGNIMTEYESKFSAKGNLINKMVIMAD
ncbi:MAG: tRNA (guanosine(46)-N7)-methyltransferase TrmB [Lachnospiraceae bacterium]|nr:tRNA (guanosine(46)-N7)-methyltransferase TrmB [Lachnospiraceae bacterium]